MTLTAAMLLPSCAITNHRPTPPPASQAPASFTILAVNDVYRINGVADSEGRGQIGGLARLRTLRRSLEAEDPGLLVLHAGDLLTPSLLSLMYEGRQMVDVLNRLDGDPQAFDPRLFVTFGNHEFDIRDASELDRRIDESQFRWLGTDLTFSSQNGQPVVDGDNLLRTLIVESNGLRIGLFSLSIDMNDPHYVQFADPLETARQATAELRQQGAEVVVALTHLRLSQDIEILQALGDQGPDLHIGGHEHSQQHEMVNGRYVLKADADAVSATVVKVTPRPDGPPRVDFRYEDLGPADPSPDPQVQERVDWWLAKHAREFCAGQQPPEPPDCLDEKLGVAGVKLVAEETMIRRYETNFGNWVADLMKAQYPRAQVAVVGSGTLRMNQDIPKGGDFTRRDLEALLPFPTRVRLLKITGADLQKAVSHSVETWTGNGWWLQVSGIAFRHDPKEERAYDLTLLTDKGPRPVQPEEEIWLAANDYIAGGRDGYAMLGPQAEVPGAPSPNLEDLIKQALAAAGPEGIKPQKEGRICNTQEADQPCLAVVR